MGQREIKFRAQSIVVVEGDPDIEDGDWVYGSLIVDKPESYIVKGVVESTDEYISIENWCPINIETAGQYTGLKDKNGVEIYEGDIVKSEWTRSEDYERFTDAVEWDGLNLTYVCGKPHDMYLYNISGANELDVIGNIYENPELLKEEE